MGIIIRNTHDIKIYQIIIFLLLIILRKQVRQRHHLKGANIVWKYQIVMNYPIRIFSSLLLLLCLYGCGTPEHKSGNEIYASFTVTPSTGGPMTVFSFDASASFSESGGKILYRWDWEDDGIWDTGFLNESHVTHSYNSLGYKTILLEIKDENENSQTFRREIFITVASREMIHIPAGEFIMGSMKGNDDEKPLHRVYLDDFLIGKYEVTNGQYVEFLNSVKRNDDGLGHTYLDFKITAIKENNDKTYKIAKGWEDHPVVGVSWYGAKAYAEWLGARLPTEAEWEKSARGTDGRDWPWGNLWSPEKCKSWDSEPHETEPVGSYPDGVSPYGVNDLAGNVYEWVADWYQADYYSISPASNPKGPETGGFKVCRGGSWVEPKEECRSSFRFGQPPDNHDTDTGFRIAK